MLALQRPSMGSSKTNRDMPFGYDFDASNDFPFSAPPPAPAPGPSLLDDADSKLLGDFFDGVSSDHFNGADFFDKALGMGGSGGYELPFGWADLPPTFMGTSSSFGGIQQAVQSGHGLPDDAFGMMGNEMPAVTSADVMAAATLLGGQNSSLHPNSIGLGNDFFSASDISRTLQTGPSSSNQSRSSLQSTSMTPFPTSRGASISTSVQGKDDFMQDTFYADMVFGSANNSLSRTRKPEEIRWGSDSGFGAASFIAPPGQESRGKLEREMLKQLDCFEPKPESQYQTSSGSNTNQTSSPVLSRATEEDARNKRRKSAQQIDSTFREDTSIEDSGLFSRKKRKSSLAVKHEDEDEDGTYKAQKISSISSRKRKQQKSNDVSQPSPAASKRRKSTVQSGGGNCSSNDGKGSKSTRENLTEDQKRENHIRSEQKRRTLIKEGFEDLGELVPELASGGFSKSAVLLLAGDWLEELMKGNEVLRAQLAVLEGRG